MRYYVLSNQSDSVIRRHIIAEVVRDAAEKPSERGESLAGRFAGPTVSILTLDELLDLPNGRQILRTWQNGSDIAFYLETARMERDAIRATDRHLHLVVEDSGEAVPPSEQARYLIKRAAFLQLESAELIARVDGLRARIPGRLSEEEKGAETRVRHEDVSNPVPQDVPQQG